MKITQKVEFTASSFYITWGGDLEFSDGQGNMVEVKVIGNEMKSMLDKIKRHIETDEKRKLEELQEKLESKESAEV